jgi:hypothetical protein
MTHAALAPGIGREFDPFLFASIGDGRYGHPLTVISALAQSDVDPWLEAVGLARLSRDQATLRLSGLIAALPGLPRSDRPVASIAEELVALLPRAEWISPLSKAKPALSPKAPLSPNLRFGLSASFMALLIVFSLLFSTHNPPQAGQNGIPHAAHEKDTSRLSREAPGQRP